MRDPSPYIRDTSPRNRDPSAAMREPSPRKREASPYTLEASPCKREAFFPSGLESNPPQTPRALPEYASCSVRDALVKSDDRLKNQKKASDRNWFKMLKIVCWELRNIAMSIANMRDVEMVCMCCQNDAKMMCCFTR